MKTFNKKSLVVLALAFIVVLSGPIATFAGSLATVNLGTASNFVILAKTGISTTGVTSIIGDIGLSPAAATYITGFSLILPAASAFSTSALVTGKVYAPGYSNPTPTNLTTAILNMQTAYTDAMGRAPNVTELGAGNIGGLTLTPGVYKWGTGLTIPTDVTLSGGANDVWIFQVAQNLSISSAKKIILSGGAKASNIFWVVAGQTTIGTTAVFNGNILDQTAIVLKTGAKLNGRALAQTAVTLDSNTVTAPTSVASTPAVPATPAIPAIPATGGGNPIVQINSGTSNDCPQYTPPTPGWCKDGTIILGVIVNGCQGKAQCISSSTSTSNFGQQVRMIAISLGQGGRGNDVQTLQQFLISQNKGSASQALARVGATSYFGILTRAALAEFQLKVGINPPLGNFGPITRAYLNVNY